MRELSLFSGAGGGLLGTKLLGFNHIGYVEYNEYCQKVIAQRIKDGYLDTSKIFGDIRGLTLPMIDNAVNYWYNSKKAMEVNLAAHRKDYSEAVTLYEKGLSIQNVADYFNMSRQAMWTILKRRGVKFRPKLKYAEDNHFYRGGPKACDRSHNLLERAIEKKIIKRLTHCEKCGNTGTFKDGRSAIQAHHDDYNKPLEVEWLCQKCHHQWHKENKPVEFEGDKKEAAKVIDVITGGFP